jgi:hypothetical protein
MMKVLEMKQRRSVMRKTKPAKAKAEPKPLTDLEFIQDPSEWPRWPILPVVKREDRECGFVFANGKPEIILAYLYGLDEIPGDTWEAKLNGIERRSYASFEELLKEWRID